MWARGWKLSGSLPSVGSTPREITAKAFLVSKRSTGRIWAEYLRRIQFIRPLGWGTTLGLHIFPLFWSCSATCFTPDVQSSWCLKTESEEARASFLEKWVASGHYSHKLFNRTSWIHHIHHKQISPFLLLVYPSLFSPKISKIPRPTPPPPSSLNSKRTFHNKYNYSSPLLAKRDLDAIQARWNLRLSLCKMVTRCTTQQSFIRKGSVRISDPLPFHIPFLAERVPCTSFVHIL